MMTRPLFKMTLIASSAILLMAAGPKADLNQDGQVTKAEFTEAARAHFAAADANGDSFISKDERKAFHEVKSANRKEKVFQKLDANGDGAITRDEMEAAGEKRKARRKAHKSERKAQILERFDTNLDGELSDAERTVMKAERSAKRKGADGKGKRGDRKGKRGKRPNPDANGDGLISLDEHMAVSDQLFTRMDANSDGVLTKGEGRKRRGKRSGKRRR